MIRRYRLCSIHDDNSSVKKLDTYLQRKSKHKFTRVKSHNVRTLAFIQYIAAVVERIEIAFGDSNGLYNEFWTKMYGSGLR